nr:MAG TPA: hypothetical protein [Caudoviricetes sp.]
MRVNKRDWAIVMNSKRDMISDEISNLEIMLQE